MSLGTWYPRDPEARRRLVSGDAVIGALLVVFAILAVALYDAVDDLGQMGRDIREAGITLQTSGRETADQIRDAYGSAADAAGALPVVGASLGERLRETGDRNGDAIERQAVATGRDLASSGTQGEHDAHRLAFVGALIAFLVPSALLLVPWLPRRAARAAAWRGPPPGST